MKEFLTILLITATVKLSAQSGVGINTPLPEASSALDISSTTKGLLIPRMTELQRVAINPSTTANGLLVYQLDGNTGFYFFNGIQWNRLNGVQGPQGIDGQNGLSTYQIWLDAGNTGTEIDFLDTLKGEQGPAGSNGLDGAPGPQGIAGPRGASGPIGATGPEGIQGPQGIDGQNGLSTYQIWLDAGNTGTEIDFLDTLKGEQGPAGNNGIDGATGTQGPQGIAGPAGNNGLSAYQIWLNTGNTGTEAEFLATLQGEQGSAGVDGLTAYQIWLSLGNTGTETDFINDLVGSQGLNGKNSLIKTVNEGPGNNCVDGGVKIEIGLDIDENGILDNNEIDHNLTTYICQLNNPSDLTLQEQLRLGSSIYDFIQDGIPKQNFYGLNFEGGLIFYIDQAQRKGLVVAPYSLATMEWHTTNFDVIGNDNINYFGGNINTQAIISQQNGSRTPAALCASLNYNGYDDWYLPNIIEAKALVNIPINLRLFVGGDYWTSNDDSTSIANYISNRDFSSKNGDKDQPRRVFAVRVFDF